MYYRNNKIIYSPSDLNNFMASPFATWIERFNIENPSKKFVRSEDPILKLLQERGNDHESDYLRHLKGHYGNDNVICLESVNPRDHEKDYENTLAAIKLKPKVIFQPFLRREQFQGFADFLIRVDDNSYPNGYYYEVWDTKLSKKVKPYFLVQLCAYSWMLENMQGVLPINTRVVLGNKEKPEFLIAEYHDYFLNLKAQFLTFQYEYNNTDSSCPDPALISEYASWTNVAKEMLHQSDSLALVANIRKTQINHLYNKNIHTLTELANSELANVPGVNTEVLDRLKTQAQLQLATKGNSERKDDKKDNIEYKIIADDNGKGLSALPASHDLDVFFDIEGNPFVEGGLEYLWGVSFIQAGEPLGKKYQFKDWWGHNLSLEKQAFIDFFTWLYKRWHDSNKNMHIYHYASYEVTAIKKLSERHQIFVEEVAELINSCAMVDLYKIVRNGLIIGEPKYSIKNVEKLYRPKRNTEEDVSSGGESIVEYEKWLELDGFEQWQSVSDIYWPKDESNINWHDPNWIKIKAIRDYNIDDCESTLELVSFLREVKIKNKIIFKEIYDIVKEENKNKNKDDLIELRKRQEDIIFKLKSYLDKDKNSKIAKGLMDVLQFHLREYKAQIFESLSLKDKSIDELFDNGKALITSDLLDQELYSDSKGNEKVRLTFSFDSEQTIREDSLKEVSDLYTDLALSGGKFFISEEGSEEKNRVVYSVKKNEWEQVKERVVVSKNILIYRPESFFTKNLEKRLCENAESFLEGKNNNKLSSVVIEKRSPVFLNNKILLPVKKDDKNRPLLDSVFKAVSEMNSSCFSIQGPPGTGKTFTASYLIKKLLANDPACRIGITSNSYKAIINLFNEVIIDTKGEYKTAFVGGKDNYQFITDAVDDSLLHKCIIRDNLKFPKNTKNEYGKQLSEMRVFASTSFKFADNEFIKADNQLDYLFVDEAGQFALANLLAITGAAKNIVLLGDQMQLEQTVQASHPGIAGSSSLQHVLNNEQVVPENRGVFLGCSYRMHPKICKPLSSVIYQNKLYSDDNNSTQKIIWDKQCNNRFASQEQGIQFVGVEHQGNSLESQEEALVVEQLVKSMLTSHYLKKHDSHAGIFPKPQSILEKDILVVSPYNQQVNLLKTKLTAKNKYPALQIGTVDKFQGQEAQVVIYSMAASNLSDSVRGISFLLNINRLNVAVSRAKTLAIIVSSNNLLDVTPKTILQVKQLNLYCSLIGQKQNIYKLKALNQNSKEVKTLSSNLSEQQFKVNSINSNQVVVELQNKESVSMNEEANEKKLIFPQSELEWQKRDPERVGNFNVNNWRNELSHILGDVNNVTNS